MHDTFSYLLPDLQSLAAETRVFLFMRGQRDIYQHSAEAGDSVECDFEAESELYSFPWGTLGHIPDKMLWFVTVSTGYTPSSSSSHHLTSPSLLAKVVPSPFLSLRRRNDLKIELL